MIAVLRPDRTLAFGSAVVRAAVGRGGVSQHKQEGDGCTPAGLLPLRRVFYRADRVARPAAAVPVEPLAPADGWCDDPSDPRYNQFVALPYAAHHEALWRTDRLYDLIGVLGWNDNPPVRGRGSAIFLHVASGDFAPTDGCIAIDPAVLAAFLAQGLSAVDVAWNGAAQPTFR